jgi:hypothetical protein
VTSGRLAIVLRVRGEEDDAFRERRRTQRACGFQVGFHDNAVFDRLLPRPTRRAAEIDAHNCPTRNLIIVGDDQFVGDEAVDHCACAQLMANQVCRANGACTPEKAGDVVNQLYARQMFLYSCSCFLLDAGQVLGELMFDLFREKHHKVATLGLADQIHGRLQAVEVRVPPRRVAHDVQDRAGVDA